MLRLIGRFNRELQKTALIAKIISCSRIQITFFGFNANLTKTHSFAWKTKNVTQLQCSLTRCFAQDSQKNGFRNVCANFLQFFCHYQKCLRFLSSLNWLHAFITSRSNDGHFEWNRSDVEAIKLSSHIRGYVSMNSIRKQNRPSPNHTQCECGVCCA